MTNDGQGQGQAYRKNGDNHDDDRRHGESEIGDERLAGLAAEVDHFGYIVQIIGQ